MRVVRLGAAEGDAVDGLSSIVCDDIRKQLFFRRKTHESCQHLPTGSRFVAYIDILGRLENKCVNYSPSLPRYLS